MEREAESDLDAIEALRQRVHTDEWQDKPHRVLYDALNLATRLVARAEKAESELGALQRHYDAAAPEHNLLALLDLYHERMVTAEAELDKARDLVHASMAQAVTCNEQARDRDSWKARALAAEPIAQAFADVRAFDCDEVSRTLYHDVVCTAHTARMRAALARLAAIRREQSEREAGER